MLRRALIAGVLVIIGIAVPAVAAPAPAPPPAGNPFTTRAANRAVAHVWASRLLGELRLPPGAVRSPGRPPGLGRALASPGFSLTGPALVDDTSWWTSAATPAALVAYVRAHLPRDRALVSHGVNGEPGGVIDGFWSYAAPPGLMQLTGAVQTARLPGGRTAVRLDAEATWLQPRPPWDRIPASVRSVTYTARASVAGPAGARPAPRTAPRTLGRNDARRLAAAINRLQRWQPGIAYSCPADTVQPRITLRFRGAAGRPLALAVALPAGCASVLLSVDGRRGPGLNDMSGAPRPLDRELVALGAIPACRTSELAAGPASLAPAGRRPTLTLSLRDDARTACTLRGYPRLELTGAHGRRLAHRRRLVDPGALRREGLAGTVILYPGTSAQFTARYVSCPARAAATAARIRLPRGTGALRTRLAPSGPRVTPCPGTTLRLSALSSAL